MSIGLLFVIFFFVCAVTLTTVGIGLRYVESSRKRKVHSMLDTVAEHEPMRESSILTQADEQRTLALSTAVRELPLVRTLDTYILQAGLTWSATWMLAAMAGLGLLGALLGLRLRAAIFREFAIFGFALLLGSLPYLFLMFKRRQRLSEFEEQFPEALDFLARSMRAGHAFSVSLEMMSDESPDPLGIEFRQVFNEQNLGAPIETALRNLAQRVPLVDVGFFVSAVLMQRETGGNLAEILTKLSYVIRERFRLKGQIKAVSAHGRITAMILSVMPLATMLALTIIAPGYLSSMAEDRDGKFLIIGAIVGQFAGYAWMRKVIDIKV